jgi:hypothetical protein
LLQPFHVIARHSASATALTRVFDALWTRVNALVSRRSRRLMRDRAMSIGMAGTTPAMTEAIQRKQNAR